MASYTTQEHGSIFSESYKMFFKDSQGNIVSPFHDIPLFADQENQVFNMVVEIPRWTNAKMEIATTDPMNSIKQDIKKGKVRFVHNCFPHKGYIWNYGAIPQTWEDPAEIDEHTKQKGDGDPIDCVEIGYKIAQRGEVKQVKVLGILAMIDEGETDWKVIAIDHKDPLACKLNDIDDVRKWMPGLIENTHDWFKVYKMPAGKPANEFAFNGEAKNRKFATDIIMKTHGEWKDLVLNKKENEFKMQVDNVTVAESPYKISNAQANKHTESLPAKGTATPLPEDHDAVHYIKRD